MATNKKDADPACFSDGLQIRPLLKPQLPEPSRMQFHKNHPSSLFGNNSVSNSQPHQAHRQMIRCQYSPSTLGPAPSIQLGPAKFANLDVYTPLTSVVRCPRAKVRRR